jgi:hypothetical protein
MISPTSSEKVSSRSLFANEEAMPQSPKMPSDPGSALDLRRRCHFMEKFNLVLEKAQMTSREYLLPRPHYASKEDCTNERQKNND